jgi:hypothetical protein
LLDGVSAEFFCLDLLREFQALLRTEVFAAFSLLAILVAASSSLGTKYPSSSKLLSTSPWKARLTASPMSPRPADIRGLDHDSLCILLDSHNAVQRMRVFLDFLLVPRQVDDFVFVLAGEIAVQSDNAGGKFIVDPTAGRT